MSSIHESISGRLGKCIEELEKTESPSEKSFSELDGIITQISKVPLNNKFDTQLEKLAHLIPNKYKEQGNAILEKISSIRKKVFSEEEKLTWMKTMASEGTEESIGLIENLNHFDLKNTPKADLLDLCLLIVEQGEMAQVCFVKNLDKLGLDRLDCLDLCGKIVRTNSNFVKILESELDKDLFIKEIAKLELTERLNFCEHVAKTGNWATYFLKKHFNDLNFVQEISVLDQSQRIPLCKKLAKNGAWASEGLISNFRQLELDKLEPSDLVELWTNVAEIGSAYQLAKNFSKIGLEKASVEQKFSLFIKLIDKLSHIDDRAVRNLLNNWGNIEKEISPIQMMQLYSKIMEKGGIESITLLTSSSFLNLFPDLRSSYFTHSEKFSLVMKLFERVDDIDIRILISFFQSFHLDNLQPNEFIDLWKKILCNNPGNIKYLDSMGLQKVPLSERLSFYMQMADWGGEFPSSLVKNFGLLSLKDASPQDRLALVIKLAQDSRAATLLPYVLPSARLERIEASQLLELYVAIVRNASEGGNAVKDLVNNWNVNKLLEVNPIQRLPLWIAMAKTGQDGAKISLAQIDLLNPKQIEDSKLLEFWSTIVTQGELLAKELTFKLHFLSPQLTDLLDCLNLCITIAETGEDAAKSLAQNFEALQLPYFLMTESQTQKLIFLLNTLLRNRVPFENLPLKDSSIPHATLVKIYIGILLDTSLDQEHISTLLEDPKLLNIKPCLKLMLFKLPLEKDPDYVQKKEEFISLQKNFQEYLDTRSEFKFLKDQFLKTKTENSIFVQSQLLKVLAYATSIFSDLEPMEWDTIRKSHLIETILSHQNPSDRFLLTKELRIAVSENIQDIKDLSRDENLSTTAEQVFPLAPLKNIERDWGKLSSLLLSHLKILGLSQEATEAILLSIDQRGFSTTKNLTTLLSFLHNLIQKGPYNSETMQGEEISEKELLENYLIQTIWDNKALEKIKFLLPKTVTELKDGKKTRTKVDQEDPMKTILGRAEIIKLDTKKPIKKKSKTMAEVQAEIQGSDNILTIFDRKQLFDFLRSHQESSEFFMEHFQELFPVGEIENLNEKFASTFGDINKFRDPKALYTYVKQLKKLPQEQKESVNKILTEYVSSVLTGTFKEKRYSTKDNPHLEIIFKDPKLKKAWLEAEPARHIANEQYSISESDDSCDLFLIGTEVQGSCQSVTSDPYSSKCLPHYLMGGEIIPIVIKDQNGKLVARSILRHLVDEKNNSILLQEKIYTNKRGDLEIEKEINEWAIRKAQSMNCPLVSMREQSEKYNGKVKFLGGRAPFQYTDAGGGVKSGPFEIDGLSLIYSPT